ncbi:MAG: putative PurR-regulated permease PerM [Blastococcus sp.]|nr:putative PurR-regulated permease PerM [Blastococcus sp.]
MSATPSLDGMADHENRGPLPLWLTVVLGVAGSSVALWGVHAASPILGPVLLAFVLTVVVHPLIGALVRRGMRKGLAVAIAVVVVDGGLILFGIALFVSVGQLATVLPEYANQWQAALAGLRDTLKGLGFGPEQVEQALRSVEPSTVLSALAGLLSRLAGTIGALVLVLATALFMTAEAAGVPERLSEVPRTAHLHAALAGFARNTRRYLVVTSVFGFAVAVVDTVALVVMGIPLPLVWGLLSFLTNYVPNIGFFLGLAPPALLGFLVGGPALGLLVIVVYSVVNFVLQSVVQPVFVGDAVNLSVTLSFLSVIAWTVVLGPIGAILAVPMTLFVHAILVGQDPDRRWARVLLAGASGEATTERRAAGRRPGGRQAGRAPTAPLPESQKSPESPGSHSASGTSQAG